MTFFYPTANHPALEKVSLQVAAGEIALVCGYSGCGKSTLLRCVNGLVPHFSGGRLEGTISVYEKNPTRVGPQSMSREVGFVFQDPESQFVVDQVEDEVAFSMENAAVPRPEMQIRLEQLLTLLNLEKFRHRRLDSLSGGERQRVAIASALALRNRILILDEPTSQLDPVSAEALLLNLVHLRDQLGITVMLAEHRLERVLPFVDQIIYLDASNPGAISGPPRQVLAQIPINPPIVQLAKKLKWPVIPLTVEEGMEIIHSGDQKIPPMPGQDGGGIPGLPVEKKQPFPTIQIRSLYAGYKQGDILHAVDLDLFPGEILVLVGPNGAGKSTLLRSIIGLTKPSQGSIRVTGAEIVGLDTASICQNIGYLPQNPNDLLFADSILDELNITLDNHGLSRQGYSPIDLIHKLGLQNMAQAYPRDLSTGERQRVALGAVIINRPIALLLDEPTRGLDYQAKEVLGDLLESMKREGMAIMVVTHDVEFAAHIATRAAYMNNGRIDQAGPPAEVLTAQNNMCPQIASLFPGSNWLTVEDVG